MKRAERSVFRVLAGFLDPPDLGVMTAAQLETARKIAAMALDFSASRGVSIEQAIKAILLAVRGTLPLDLTGRKHVFPNGGA